MNKAQSRYYTDENGKEWFAIKRRIPWIKSDRTEEEQIIDGTLYRYEPGTGLMKEWIQYISPSEVQITDALACSRAQLGPVYVVVNIDSHYPSKLIGIVSQGALHYTAFCGVMMHDSRRLRLATLKELKEAGIE